MFSRLESREGTSIIVPITNRMVGLNKTIERGVNAQNMTTNMMDGNTAGAEDSSGNIRGEYIKLNLPLPLVNGISAVL